MTKEDIPRANTPSGMSHEQTKRTKKEGGNLRSINDMTPEEFQRFQKMGSEAAAKASKDRKTFANIARHLLNATVKEGDADDVRDVKSIAEAHGMNLSVMEISTLKMLEMVLSSKTKASDKIKIYQMLRDTIGEAPVHQISADIGGTSADGSPSEIRIVVESPQRRIDRDKERILKMGKGKGIDIPDEDVLTTGEIQAGSCKHTEDTNDD